MLDWAMVKDNFRIYNSKYNGAMLRTSIYSNYLKQGKIEQKKQRSQQARGMRSRKNNSPSPVYKQINMNKQNMHPNRPNLNVYLDQQQYRQAYYQIKQNNLHSRAEQQKQPQPTAQSSCIRNSKPPREIQIKLTNRSLEKCQIHPLFQPSPKAQYLLNYQQGPNQNDVLCCDKCSWNYGNNTNKINLDRVTQTVIGNGVTIKQYYSLLLKKIEELQIARNNTEGWENGWRQMCVQQGNKLRKHYNEILEIIQISMRGAEDRLAGYLNEGERVLALKKQEIQSQLEKTRCQMKKLLLFQQKQLTFQFGSYLRELSFDIESSKKKFQLEIQLPVVHIYTQIPNLKLEFQKIFRASFSVEPLSNAQLQQRQHERQKQVVRSLKLNKMSLSPYSSLKSVGIEEGDLFCEQSLGESKSKGTNEFSFESSRMGRNQECILELVEQQDVISPVFKAI